MKTMEIINAVLAVLGAHPVLSTLIVVPLVTYLGNLLIAWLSGPRWLTLLTKYPRLAAVMKVAQALGVDPVRLARWALTVLTGKLPQAVKLPPGVYTVSETIEVKPSAPSVPPLPLIVLALTLPLAACSWLSRPSHYADAAKILSCISAEAAAGKSPADIALTCGLENADAVIDLVTKSQGVASAAPKMAKPAASVKP